MVVMKMTICTLIVDDEWHLIARLRLSYDIVLVLKTAGQSCCVLRGLLLRWY